MKITCRACKKKSRTSDQGSSVGDLQMRSGFTWLPTASGQSLWLCPKCAEKLLGFTKGITDLMGELYIYPATLQDILQRSLEKGAKVRK